MRTSREWYLALFLIFVPIGARAEPPVAIGQDIWNVAYLGDGKAGTLHTRIREIERDGQKLLRTTTELNLTIKRNEGTIDLRMENGTEETPEGKVSAVFMKQYHLGRVQLELHGTVRNGVLEVKYGGRAGDLQRKVPWNPEVAGLYRQERIFQDRKVKPGDHFSFLSYEPTINNVVTNRVAIKDYEEVEVLGVQRRLLRAHALPDKIEVPGASVQLPGMTFWLDQDLLPVMSQFEIPQLGNLVLYRTSEEVARQRGPMAKIPDIYLNSLIPVKRRILQPNQTGAAVYRITVKEDENPATTFAQDERQQCRNIQGNTFELVVQARREPQNVQGAAAVNEEFLKSCHFIDCNDPRIKQFTLQAIGDETEPLKKARSIESWVHNHMHVGFTETFAPASEVARTMRGDCRQHALLATAMCRAAGIPARTALGLCYGNDPKRGPVMAFHMWTEIWVQGQWLAIDATRGQGYVGATHLKITDSSWADTQSLTPLLPVIRVLGKLSIEIVSVDGSASGGR